MASLTEQQMKNQLLLLVLLSLFGNTYANDKTADSADDTTKAKTHELKLVKQITNINAKSAGTIHQFIPDYLEINTGDSVKFLGTVGRHTVHSIKNIYPEGFKKISIRHIFSMNNYSIKKLI